MVVHAIYIGVIGVLFVVLIWQRIRAGFWKRLYKQSVEFKGEIERFRRHAHFDNNQWPELFEEKES